MPFTFCHPAIVLPLSHFNKKWISLTGLVIGSIVPDFEYFIRMRIYSVYSHTWVGSIYFNLPLAVVLSFIFHLIIRDELIDNLPLLFRQRLVEFKKLAWVAYFKEKYFIIIISISIGIVSHLLWDSFTHKQGYFVEQLPLLSGTMTLYSLHIPLYKILQHSSSLIGGLVIMYTILNLSADEFGKQNKNLWQYWLIVAAVTLVIISVRFAAGLDLNQYGDFVVTGIAAGLIGLILTPLIIKVIKLFNQAAKSGTLFF